MDTIFDPLTQAPTEEVLLMHSPLSRVLAQIRFPTQESINSPDFVRPFAEIIQADYPVSRPIQNKGVVIGPQGPIEHRTDTTWRFGDEEGNWIVTLSREFLALETSQYTDRETFLLKLEKLLGVFQRHIGAASIDRIGVRYIYRFDGEDLEHLESLVRPTISGLMTGPMTAQIRLCMSEYEFEVPEHGRLRTRWGLIPAGSTIDPSTIPPMGAPSFVLDLDAFAVESRALDIDNIVEEARDFAERLQTFLLWAVTNEFLSRFQVNT